MQTIIIDPNQINSDGLIFVAGPALSDLVIDKRIRMLEIESGEYWYGDVEFIEEVSNRKTMIFIKPLHQSSYGGWIDYEQNT